MLNFWEAKMKNRMVLLYTLAPFLEEAGSLLRAAAILWHPWSVKRSEELEKIACELRNDAQLARSKGLSWACSIHELGGDSAFLLSTSAHTRYYKKESGPEACPEAVPFLVNGAVQILLLLLPVYQKIEKMAWEEKNLVKVLCEKIEVLMESPCIGAVPELSEELIRILGMRGMLLECEGLSYTQAKIEDSFSEHNKKSKKKRGVSLSDAEIHNLAEEIGMPFETVKEVFEREYSPWWKRMEKYEKQAQGLGAQFVSLLSIRDEVQRAMLSAWRHGMVIQNGTPNCWSESQLESSEKIIQTFISMFLSYKGERPSRAIPALISTQ